MEECSSLYKEQEENVLQGYIKLIECCTSDGLNSLSAKTQNLIRLRLSAINSAFKGSWKASQKDGRVGD